MYLILYLKYDPKVLKCNKYKLKSAHVNEFTLETYCSTMKSLVLNMQPGKKIDKAALQIFKNFSFVGIQLTRNATFSLLTYCQWCVVKENILKRVSILHLLGFREKSHVDYKTEF